MFFPTTSSQLIKVSNNYLSFITWLNLKTKAEPYNVKVVRSGNYNI